MTHSPKLVTIFGGSGFVGRYLVQELANRGHRVRVAVRRPDLANYLQPLGGVGQIQAVQANIRYHDSIDAAAKGSDAIVNLVAILAEGGNQRYSSVHIAGARSVAEAAKANHCPLIQMSAIGADGDSPAGYARSRWQA